MIAILAEETGTAQATATGAQPKPNKKARVAPRSAHVAPKPGKLAKKASPPKKAPKGGKKASVKKAGAARQGSKTAKVLDLLKRRGIPFSQPHPSPWISGLMKSVRNGQRHQVIDHLICCALIEGRSCEKFQILARELGIIDAELAKFYASLVESEGNHYANYILMARAIDDAETDRRLDFFLDLDAELIREPNPLPMLH